MVEGVDVPALLSWMDERSLGSGPIHAAELLAGGTQNILVRFERAGRGYVLRRPPLVPRANSNQTIEREAKILAALANGPVPHPGLIGACADPSVLGACFILMEPVDGFNAASGLPPFHTSDTAVRGRMGLAMVEGAASLASLDIRALGLESFGKLENYLERQVARWASQLDDYGKLPGWHGPGQLPGVERVGRWLNAHRPPSFTPGIIHGDYHFANVMFRHHSGELAAIIDWELSTLGDPLLDLGWLIANWPDDASDPSLDFPINWQGFATASDLVTHYGQVSGRDLADFDWFAVLACYKLGIILEGTFARACAGHAPKAVGERLHAKAIDLFERALRRIN